MQDQPYPPRSTQIIQLPPGSQPPLGHDEDESDMEPGPREVEFTISTEQYVISQVIGEGAYGLVV